MRIPFFAAALCCLAATAPAQFALVPNAGCPGPRGPLGAIKWAGTPTPGAQIDAKSACSSLTETPFFLVGLPTLLPINPPTACVSGCQLAVFPVLVTAPPQSGSAPISFVIPNNPGLVGASITMQGLCADFGLGCITLTQGVSMTVQ